MPVTLTFTIGLAELVVKLVKYSAIFAAETFASNLILRVVGAVTVNDPTGVSMLLSLVVQVAALTIVDVRVSEPPT